MKIKDFNYKIDLDIDKELKLKRLPPESIYEILLEGVSYVDKYYNEIYKEAIIKQFKHRWFKHRESPQMSHLYWLALNKKIIEKIEHEAILTFLAIMVLQFLTIVISFVISYFLEPAIKNALGASVGKVELWHVVLAQAIVVAIIFKCLDSLINKIKKRIYWKIITKYYPLVKERMPQLFKSEE
jgi:hypothetical protein